MAFSEEIRIFINTLTFKPAYLSNNFNEALILHFSSVLFIIFVLIFVHDHRPFPSPPKHQFHSCYCVKVEISSLLFLCTDSPLSETAPSCALTEGYSTFLQTCHDQYFAVSQQFLVLIIFLN